MLRRNPSRYLTVVVIVGVLVAMGFFIATKHPFNRSPAESTHVIKPSSSKSMVRLPPNQRIFVVARDDWGDNWTEEDEDESREHITADTRAERLARAEFIRLGRVRLADDEQDADFLFLMVIDPGSGKHGLLAELDTPECNKHPESFPEPCVRWVAEGDTPAHLVQRLYRDFLP